MCNRSPDDTLGVHHDVVAACLTSTLLLLTILGFRSIARRTYPLNTLQPSHCADMLAPFQHQSAQYLPISQGPTRSYTMPWLATCNPCIDADAFSRRRHGCADPVADLLHLLLCEAGTCTCIFDAWSHNLPEQLSVLELQAPGCGGGCVHEGVLAVVAVRYNPNNTTCSPDCALERLARTSPS